MSLKTELKLLVDELDRIHQGATPWSEEKGIPEFVTAENGMQRFINHKARASLWRLSNTLYQNRPQNSLKIEIAGYLKIVRQAVADMHAADEFIGFQKSDQGKLLPKLKSLIEERISSIVTEHTHYLPAWTLGMEELAPYILGPVTILNRFDWIDAVDFPQQGKDRFLNQPEANYRWKEILKDALHNPDADSKIEGLAGAVYRAVVHCPALVKVTVNGYDYEFSYKLARLVSKTALDAISLGVGAPECFLQQALQDERLPPLGSSNLVQSKGFLWLPGNKLGKRIPPLSPQRVKKALTDLEAILPSFAAILHGLVDPSTHPHPKLAKRWSTALDWFGEGCRESSDSIALAKLGTCLDVLCGGGKNVGILNMVMHLTGTSSDTQVIDGCCPRTLGQLVKDIYDLGRSKILHGTRYDRLESFALERQHAAHLARIILIQSAIRLQHYTGPDEDNAFSTI